MDNVARYKRKFQGEKLALQCQEESITSPNSALNMTA